MDTLTATPTPAEWLTAGPATRQLIAVIAELRSGLQQELADPEHGDRYPAYRIHRDAAAELADQADEARDRLAGRILDQVIADGADQATVDLLMSIHQGAGRDYLDGVAAGLAAVVFGVAAAEDSVVAGPDYLVLTAGWRRCRWPYQLTRLRHALPGAFPGTPAAGEPLHVPHLPYPGVDVDADIAAAAQAGTQRQVHYRRPAADRLWADLGLPMEQVERSNVEGSWTEDGTFPASGLYRRLAATLQSVAERADGNTAWSVSEPERGERSWPEGRPGPGGDFVQRQRGSFRLRWWSYGGCSGSRAWWIEATVSVAADSWLATYASLCDVTLAVRGSGGEVTRYRAAGALDGVLGGLVMRLLARDTARVLAGAESHRTPWVDSHTLGVWVADLD